MNNYDEDLKVNAFYKTLLEYEADLENASKKDWIICIPRNGTIKEPITQSDIYNHILVPNGASRRYTTLNNLVINITDNKIQIDNDKEKDDCFPYNTIRILFNETFYHKHLKYKIYCIEFPLSRHFVQSNPISQISNLRDCIDFLWIETYGREVFQKITETCQIYLAHSKIQTNSATKLEPFKESIERLYHKCLEILLENSRLQEKTKSKHVFYNLKLATETFMQHTLNNHIFAIVCAITSHHDSNLNKITRNLQDIQMKHFQIGQYQELIPTARCELNKVNHYITTLGKIQCLRGTFNILSQNVLGKLKRDKEILNVEVLIQLFAFLIIKLNINNWVGNLTFMKEFMFSNDERQDENAFLLTTLEAAIEYVKAAPLTEKLNSDIDCSPNNIIIEIRNCNVDNLKTYFLTENSQTFQPEQNLTLCHPLCSCDNCEQLLTKSRANSQTCFHFIDEKGRNCLHVACMYGYPQIVDLLLHKQIPFSTADYSGAFPIHYAAQRGHLNSLLLLLHSGADLNIVNADGNTPLHLASNNGHENCIKGLLYYSEHQNGVNVLNINCCNAWGESALHLAAKWGYLNIVSILLEYKIDFRIRNKRNETCMDLAHSVAVKKLIASYINVSGCSLSSVGNCDAKSHAKVNGNDFMCHATGECEDSKSFGIRPKNFEQFKKADLLLKAIENNDLPLSCFYLGIPTSSNLNNNSITNQNTANKSSAFHCHPLCDCPLCLTNKSSALVSTSQQIKLNVNICNSEGFTALHVAAQFGRNEILRLLLDAGADCNLQTYKAFYSPLHLACINQRVLAIKELLLSGSCNVDMQDGKGNSALHYACTKNDLRILDILLSKGADASVKNNRGKTVLRLAQERSLFAVVKMIREKTREKETNASYEDIL